MREFELKQVSEDRGDDIKADLRMRMFFLLKEAYRNRLDLCVFTLKELAKAVGKDVGYVSRIMSGRSNGINIETLAVMLDALDIHLELKAVPREKLPVNIVDVRPHRSLAMPVYNVNLAHTHNGSLTSKVANLPKKRQSVKFEQDLVIG